MKRSEFLELRKGEKVRCINSEGWASFTAGGIYEVTSVWALGVDIDGKPAAALFSEDFEKVEFTLTLTICF